MYYLLRKGVVVQIEEIDFINSLHNLFNKNTINTINAEAIDSLGSLAGQLVYKTPTQNLNVNEWISFRYSSDSFSKFYYTGVYKALSNFKNTVVTGWGIADKFYTKDILGTVTDQEFSINENVIYNNNNTIPSLSNNWGVIGVLTEPTSSTYATDFVSVVSVALKHAHNITHTHVVSFSNSLLIGGDHTHTVPRDNEQGLVAGGTSATGSGENSAYNTMTYVTTIRDEVTVELDSTPQVSNIVHGNVPSISKYVNTDLNYNNEQIGNQAKITATNFCFRNRTIYIKESSV